MRLSRTEFEARYARGDLRIALIGMSNIGKSYTGSRLADAFDFELLEVDRIIWEALGQGNMADFAKWQGQPYSEGYAAREARSIAMETDATAQALDYNGRNAILDTTGSVIYTDKTVQRRLKQDWFIVHIAASDSAVEQLKIQYFENPKPLIWSGHYKRAEGQSENEAILTSYPSLLSSRAKAYDALADVTLSSDLVLDPSVTIADIFEQLKPAR